MQDESLKQDLEHAQARMRMWDDLKRLEGWNELVKYLEGRFVELGESDCNSVKELANRNGRMNEIRRIFGYIMHDFKMEQALIREYQAITSLEDELPPPPMHF